MKKGSLNPLAENIPDVKVGTICNTKISNRNYLAREEKDIRRKCLFIISDKQWEKKER